MALTRLPSFTLLSTDTFTFGNANVSGNVTGGNILTDNLLHANGAAWTFGGTYSNTNVSAYLTTAVINTTGNITAGNITTSGAGGNISGANYVIANYFTGNGSLLTHITGANIDGYAPLATTANSATTAGTVTTNAQPNITSVGTLSSLSVTGLTTATGGVKTGNIQGTDGTIVLQTNYNTKAGDLGVVGNIVAGTGGAGNVTATYFIGNGSQLTGLPASYSNTNVTAYLTTATINTTGNITGNYITGNGSQLTHINGANVDGTVPLATSAATAGTVTTAAQPNITSVGTLTSLNVTNDVVIGGNLTVSGTQTTVNSTTVNVNDVNIVLANNATNQAQANGGGITINGANASLVYLSSSNAFSFSHPISADGSLLTSISGGNVSGNVSQAVHSYYSDSANSVAGANVTGNVSQAVHSYYSDSANNVAGGNVTGQVANALVSGTVYTNAQPNITSVGTLSNLSVTGNITAGSISTAGTSGNISGANYIIANYFVGNGAFLTGISAGTTYSNSNVAAYLPTYSGDLSAGNVDFTTASNVSLGSVGNIHIAGGTTGQFLKTDGAGNLSWATASGGGGGGGITYTAATTPPGTPAVADQWYNTTTNTLYEYISDGTNSYWVDIQSPTISTSTYQSAQLGFSTRTYTGTGSQTTFTVSSGLVASSAIVTIDGVVQTPISDYSISNGVLTFTTAPYAGGAIQIRELASMVPYVLSNLNSIVAFTATTSNVQTATASNLIVTGTITNNTGPVSIVDDTTITGNLSVSSNTTVSGNVAVTGNIVSTSLRAQSMVMGIIFGG